MRVNSEMLCLTGHPRVHTLYQRSRPSLAPPPPHASTLWPTSLLLQHLPLFKWEQRSSFLSSVPPSQGSLPSLALFLRPALHDGKPVPPPPQSLATYSHIALHLFVAVACVEGELECSWDGSYQVWYKCLPVAHTVHTCAQLPCKAPLSVPGCAVKPVCPHFGCYGFWCVQISSFWCVWLLYVVCHYGRATKTSGRQWTQTPDKPDILFRIWELHLLLRYMPTIVPPLQ